MPIPRGFIQNGFEKRTQYPWSLDFNFSNYIQKSQTTCIHSQELQPWRLFCLNPAVQTSATWWLGRLHLTAAPVSASPLTRWHPPAWLWSLWTGGWCETRNETKVETICLNQTAITARGDGTIILCQQDASTNTFNSIGRKGIMHENGIFFERVKPPENKKHTISAKDEHVRAHCPVPNSPRSLQVNMKSIIFSVPIKKR